MASSPGRYFSYLWEMATGEGRNLSQFPSLSPRKPEPFKWVLKGAKSRRVLLKMLKSPVNKHGESQHDATNLLSGC